MTETVVSVGLAVGEHLQIKKQVLSPVYPTGKEKRFCVVTGTHGDELEGQYVCWEVNRRIQENIHQLKGIVEIYPALNPLGVDSITRGVPGFDLDMNRVFPGEGENTMPEYVAHQIISDIQGASMCIDIHASNIFLREIPQVRINVNSAKELIPYARKINVDFLWVHGAATVLESTLAYSLNAIGVPTLVVEMGVGMRITEEFGHQLTDGIFALMKEMGIWEGETIEPKEPIICMDSEVGFLNANCPGIFLPCVKHWMNVKEGELIGRILNPLTGQVAEEVRSPMDGVLFTLREYPVVSPGSLLARVSDRKTLLRGGGKDGNLIRLDSAHKEERTQ